MTDNTARQADGTGAGAFPQPPSQREEARRRLVDTFRPGELIWLAGETYDAPLGFWHMDVLRAGNFGGWVRQRYRYDEAAEVLYFLGETTLSDADFRTARATASIFPVPAR